MLEPLYTADEMRAAEAGHDVEELMARAGRAVALEAMRAFAEAERFTAVCGGGANGGDGRIAVDVLREAGRDAVVVDAKAGETELGSPDVVIDALFGTGFRGAPRPDAAALIERINALHAPVVAVDLPSGVNADTGEIGGVAVRADVTVTMHGPKVGLDVAPGRFHAGDVVVADIGLEQRETAARLVGRDILRLVPRKRQEDNKYSAGAVLVVGGSPGMTGAVCLAAEAAFRADAGYVTVCAPSEALPVVELRLLEAVKRPLDEAFAAAERMGAMAIGPGLGRSDERRALVRRLLEEVPLPAVLDADALFELEPFQRDAPTVLTPHAGELARLLGRESPWVSAHRLAALEEAVERFACVVLLKGSDTLIGAPGEGVLVRPVNTPALATAGTGDVLTGILAAFLAKGLDARLGAAAAATAHALAAAHVTYKSGLVASDVIAHLPAVLD
jgi:NAD(P)H-hydrate epimerase